MNDQTIAWPERPTCHDGDWQASRFGQSTWRKKGEKLRPDADLPEPFSTCSYCGSIHPEDLLAALQAGATLSGADWKYGWPHKFYVDNIPNPNAGGMSYFTSTRIAGDVPTIAELNKMQEYADTPGYEVRTVATGRFSEETGKPLYELAVFRPEGPTTHGKWYNTHLKDLSPEAFAVLAQMIEQRAGIRFVMDGGELKYAAPHVGYQR